ncbi:MAG: DNA-3-methyladenine glycosylase I [Deltaproteobacteria bacterium]|jgi:DNA-3-methyladenine glycosylase I|nr:DNA-3-methyladenine glycosylase I [Deltaproteobacteria bacterium]
MTETYRRCPWCGDDPLYREYHDHEWGVPLHDDVRLFEMLTLEGAQAGLSWLTILRKREGYRRAFAGFDPLKVAAFSEDDIVRLLADPGIVRNRLKIASTITNARTVLEVQNRYGSLDRYLWSFVDGAPIRNCWSTMGEVPASTQLSDTMSKELKRLGFRFVGSTICYALMQATGMVNDHLTGCFCYRSKTRPHE